jgi:hypothetical protein
MSLLSSALNEAENQLTDAQFQQDIERLKVMRARYVEIQNSGLFEQDEIQEFGKSLEFMMGLQVGKIRIFSPSSPKTSNTSSKSSTMQRICITFKIYAEIFAGMNKNLNTWHRCGQTM